MVQVVQSPSVRRQPELARVVVGPDGRPLGTVQNPSTRSLIGRGGATVFLQREPLGVPRQGQR